MTTETLTALQDSIRHWHRLATGKRDRHERMGTAHCALCQCFRYGSHPCFRCPVSERSRDVLCRGTPYENAVDAWTEAHGDYQSLTFRRAAAKELAFLLDLLPAEARPAMDAELAAFSGTCHVCGLWDMQPETFVQKDGLVCAACA